MKDVFSMNDQKLDCNADFFKNEKPRNGKLPDAVHGLEKQMILEAMARSGGNQRLASQILGITERMLGYRLKQYGLKFFI